MVAPVETLLYKATGSTTPRTLGNRAADIVNVRDYGAVGDGSTNDATAIQNAFNAAFGSSGSPHGTSSNLNRSVYFPGGFYLVNSQLTLTQVLGGHIFGDTPRSSVIIAGSGIGSILTIDGFENCRVENLGFQTNFTNVGCLNLDVLSSGSAVQLRNNLFLCCKFTNAGGSLGLYGVLIAASGNDGAANTFIRTEIAGLTTGVKCIGTNATNNSFLDSDFTGGGGETHVWVAGGSISNLIGCQWAGLATLGIKIETGDTFIAGSRMETETAFLAITGGSVAIYDFALGLNAATVFVSMTSPARVALSGINDFNAPQYARLTGTGVLEIRGSNFNIAFLSGFTGTLSRWQLPTGAFSTLPTGANAMSGMEANITDGDATLTFGHVETGGGSAKKYVRYNGSNWTVMGV